MLPQKINIYPECRINWCNLIHGKRFGNMNLMSVPELEPQTSCVTAETVHATPISKLYKQRDFQTSDHTGEAK